MASSAILRNTVIGNTLVSFFGYALVLWVPVYLVRVHEMGTGEVGTILALLVGLGGAVGTYFGGVMADRLSARHPGWRAWVVVAAYTIVLPLAALSFLAESAYATIALYVLPAMLAGTYIGPSFAIIQGSVPLRMRSVAAAINLFILNIIGLGLGPFSVGLISDLTADAAGVGSLRYGLLAMIPVGLWGALHYLRAGFLLGREAQ
ncbi:MAG: MFS transporter [Gammaproteobacteria bacterium]|nr:MAG: MFS transporter [Gammaproteobacteria bacterium]